MEGTLKPLARTLAAAVETLGIPRADLANVEPIASLQHQFDISAEVLAKADFGVISQAFHEFGESLALTIALGELTELALSNSTTISDWTSFIGSAEGEYQLVVAVDKELLAAEIAEAGKGNPQVHILIFAEALSRLLRLGLRHFEELFWKDPDRGVLIVVLDEVPHLHGPYFRLTSLSMFRQNEVSVPLGPDRRELMRIRGERDRIIAVEESHPPGLIPLHLEFDTDDPKHEISQTFIGYLTQLVFFHTADRVRVREASTGQTIRAEYRGAGESVWMELKDGAPLAPFSREEVTGLLASFQWCYSETSEGRSWLAERLPFFQSRVARLFTGTPEAHRPSGLVHAFPSFLPALDWHWRAFIDGRVTVYLESSAKVQDAVSGAILSIRERSQALSKAASDSVLAAVGIVIGSFVAAALTDPFNEAVFRTAANAYAWYVAVFPGLLGLAGNAHSFLTHRANFRAQLAQMEDVVPSERIRDIKGNRVRNAFFGYWAWFTLTGAVFVALVFSLMWCAGNVPQLLHAN